LAPAGPGDFPAGPSPQPVPARAAVIGELVDYLSRDDMAQVEHSLSRYFGLLRT
jgi:hypothetical protein